MIISSSLKYPSHFLQRYIYYYTYTEAEYKDDLLHFQIFPTPEIKLYFNFASKGFGENLEGKVLDVPLHGVLGIQTQMNYQLTVPSFSTFRHLVVFFKPGGFSQLLQTNGAIITNSYTPINDLLSNELDSLANRLADKEDFPGRVDILENYFLNRLKKFYSPVTNIEYAVEKIISSYNGVNIKKLSSECNLSLRQFERRFKEVTGVSATNLHSIKRFDRALRSKEKTPGKRWVDIAYEVGYADQMHMIRDFKKFTNKLPSSSFSYDVQEEGTNWHMLRDLVNV